MSQHVFITRLISEVGIIILQKAGFEIKIHEEKRPMIRSELEKAFKGSDAVITMVYDRVDASLLDGAPRLKIVANLAVGTDNIDIPACTARGITVTNTPGILTEATADLTMALILAAARRLAEGDRFVRRGLFNSWDPLLLVGAELQGKVLGIIGMGRIGTAVAQRAQAFGMKIIYYKRCPLSTVEAARYKAEYMPLEEVIGKADFLSLHLPYTPEVRHLINRERLNLMKPTAYLINTARGGHIDEKSLVEHLKANKIAGAALDVYEHEPALSPGLADLDNVTLLPHLGSATVETRNKMAQMAAENVRAVLTGQKPQNPVG
ncbi:MAG: D-glycerate dehydrogenase [Bacillota bacterium]|nr:D-glycerate dehydrogenase [Bacillota bacterium]